MGDRQEKRWERDGRGRGWGSGEGPVTCRHEAADARQRLHVEEGNSCLHCQFDMLCVAKPLGLAGCLLQASEAPVAVISPKSGGGFQGRFQSSLAGRGHNTSSRGRGCHFVPHWARPGVEALDKGQDTGQGRSLDQLVLGGRG